MAVTELALFKLKNEDGVLTEDVRAALKQAKDVMEEYSGKSLYYAQQIEDPRLIYGLGDWMSVEAHHDALELTQERLEGFLNVLDIESLVHLDVSAETIQLNAPVLSLARFFVAKEQRADFSECFASIKPRLQELLTEGTLATGWKQESTDQTDEFVVFAPWRDVAQHLSCARKEGYEKIGEIRKYIVGNETKHVKVLKI